MTPADSALLGREQNIQVLEAALRSSQEGTPSFVLISGEAGIGKSSLLRELSGLANQSGFLVLEGSASEYDHELPYGVLTDALDAYLASLGPQALERLATDRLGAVASLSPSLAAIGQSVEYPASATERFRVHRAVRELLERLAARAPLALVLDDLHWADDASLELIAYLQRHPPQAEVLVAIALRPGQGDPGVINIVESIRNAQLVQRVELGPLSLDEVRVLVGERADELHHLSGGNPFYALQLARSSPDDTERSSLDGVGVPTQVGRAILSELAGLSAEARSLAEAAAVVGDPFEIEDVAAALDTVESDILAALDELVWKDLVRVTEVPRRFRFRHPIVRSAVYNSCSPSIRISCHTRVAAHLASRGAVPGEMAYHVEQAARRGDLGAIEVLQRAGEQAADNAPASAIRWFQSALRLLTLDQDPGRRIEILSALSASLVVLGRLGEALDAIEEARLLAGSGGEDTLSLTIACANMELLLGHLDDSKGRLEQAFEALPDQDSADGVSIAIALTSAIYQTADFASSDEWGRRAARAAEASDDKALLAAARAVQSMGAAMSGDLVPALQMRAQAEDLVDALEDDQIAKRLDALSHLATAELHLDRYVDSVRHGERCLRLARISGQTHVLPTLAPALGTSLWVVGDLARSATVLDDAIDAARLADNVPSIAWGLFNRALTALLAGDLDHAFALSTESTYLAGLFDTGVIAAYAGVIHGFVLLERGEAAASIEQVIDSGGGEDLPLLPGTWRPFYIETLARGHLALSDLDRAREMARWARQEAEGFGMDMPLLMADRAEAEVALVEGMPAEALELASSAMRRSEAIGSGVHLAISKLLAGRALAETAHPNQAVDYLMAAASEFDHLGMSRHRDRTEGLLRKLGHTVHRRSRRGEGEVGLASLTGRELEIAELVLDRHTNREIAGELFLSTKTVETHMRNIFNKLGVTSRVEVARALATSKEP